MTDPNSLESNFSLMLGGPIFHMYVRSHLSGTDLELAARRIVAITAFVWVPLLLLAIAGHAAGGLGPISFFRDVEVQVRFLVALPVLLAAEVMVHRRLRFVVRNFIRRDIVRTEDVPAFDKAIESAIRLRDSVAIESAMIVSVYALGVWIWGQRPPPATATWYTATGERWRLTPAGFWYVFVSIPIFQVIFVRWYLRLFIWFRFLWQTRRLNLHLVPTHPDRAGGLGFLGRGAYIFGPILFAQGALVAGLIGSRILYAGESLTANKLEIGGFLAVFMGIILGPLLMFTPGMIRAKRQGLGDYGVFSEQYVARFEQKWISPRSPPLETLLGTPDIQSLADLDNSYGIVRQMRVVPFGTRDVITLAALTAAPLSPLLLTIFSVDELIKQLVRLVF
jgi:hypothetical protein